MATYEYVTFKGQELTLYGTYTSPFDQTCEWEDCDKIIKDVSKVMKKSMLQRIFD